MTGLSALIERGVRMKYCAEIKCELEKAGCAFLENRELKTYTSFKIGGSTPVLIQPNSAETLVSALDILKKYDSDYFILGNGSNILVPDDGLDYPVIHLEKGVFSEISVCGDRITAGAGVLLISVCRAAAENSLTGLEFAYGIPGSVGGGVFMNAGAYGGELSDVLELVEYIGADGKIHTEKREDLDFSYRRSPFTDGGAVILKAVFKLKHGDNGSIRAVMEDVMGRRKSKQPLEYPSAGSVFKRPEGYFAGKLIEDAGLKGCRRGGAMVSDKHAGFIINRGKASAKDVLELIELVRAAVREKFNVELETEIRILK